MHVTRLLKISNAILMHCNYAYHKQFNSNALRNDTCHMPCNSIALHICTYHKQFNSTALHNCAYHEQCNSNALQNEYLSHALLSNELFVF